jgi:pimeloyl-ACP methyl ester carboxylesterase
MAQHSVRLLPSGKVTSHYDPAIADPMREQEPEDVDLWAVWDAVTLPALVVHGEHSDVLLPDTLERMLTRPRTTLHVVPDTGHAPALMDPPSIDAVARFLAAEAA